MTDARVPLAGSLEARVIRACPEHVTCALDCPKRPIKELGTIARFDTRRRHPLRRLKEWFTWPRSSRT